jgi:hypothetical protein
MAAPAHIARENGKMGGRRKGSKNKKTLEKEAALARFQERVRAAVDPLFESQFTIAQGCTYLYFVPRGTKQPVIVKDPVKIALHLKGELKSSKGEYYFITTERPDNKAIDSLLDRTFGKAPYNVELGGTLRLANDDIRAVISTLPKDDQKMMYATLAKALEKAKRSAGQTRKGAGDVERAGDI